MGSLAVYFFYTGVVVSGAERVLWSVERNGGESLPGASTVETRFSYLDCNAHNIKTVVTSFVTST